MQSSNKEPESPMATNSSIEEEFKDYHKNPLKRKMYDSDKLKQQQKELFKMASQNSSLSEAMQYRMKKDRVQNQHTRYYATVALCGCTVTNPFRERVIAIVVNPWFDRFILLVIMANCVVISIEDPLIEKSKFFDILDYLFLAIFTVESILKIIALGFVMRPFSYMRDTWNVLDFVVVITGWISVKFTDSNISSIRVVRILRPLRTINSMPGMSGLVTTLLRSVPQMLNISILFSFNILIFATIGMQFFSGDLKNRCVENSTLNNDDWSAESYLLDIDGAEVFCSTNIRVVEKQCPELYTCEIRENPNFGLTSFDNILTSVLTVFELITLEGWTDQMYTIRRAQKTNFYDVYFVLCIIFGAFFILNLMIAVQFNYLNESFNEIDAKKKLEKIQAKRELLETMALGEADRSYTCWQRCVKRVRNKRERHKNCCENNCPCLHKIWIKLSSKTKVIVENTKFQVFITILIVLNSFILASEHYEQPEWVTEMQTYSNLIFTSVFALEMILKLLGLGLLDYVKDRFNIFDGVIVMFSLAELNGMPGGVSSNRKFTVLRGFRLLRVFKLLRSWTSLKELLQTVLASLPAIANLGMLTFLMLFIYALVGKQFYNGEMLEEDGSVSRYTFNTMPEALLVMFIVLSSENWNSIMRTVYHNYGVSAIFFFTSAVMIGNFMLLNLFLAIMLKYIESEKEEDEDDTSDKKLSAVVEESKTQGKKKQSEIPKTDRFLLKPEVQQTSVSDLNEDEIVKVMKPEKEESESSAQKSNKAKGQIKLEGRSLFIFSATNPIRVYIAKFISNSYFENMIYHLIGLNSVLLMIDEPIVTDKYTIATINMSFNIISAIFIIEAILKIIKCGFIAGKNTYLREPFNILDFIIVIFSVASFVLDNIESINISISYIKAFRALRALRPLKLVSKNAGMKLVVTSLLAAIPNLVNVMLISLLFFYVFGIIGVQLLAGRVASCYVNTSVDPENESWEQNTNAEYNQRLLCEGLGGHWQNPPFHFNNIIASMLTFFEISTLEMWPDTMFVVIDSSSEVDGGPILNNRQALSLLFVVFIFITSFFVMNLFISVILNMFSIEKQKTEGTAGLTHEQKEWVKIQRYMVEVQTLHLALEPGTDVEDLLKPKLTGSKKCDRHWFRRMFFFCAESIKFEWIITVCIVLNTITLSMEYQGGSQNYQDALDITNYVFVGIFALEAIVKIIGWGPRFYFNFVGNQFDFLVVLLSAIPANDSALVDFNLTSLRIVRVARLLRLLKSSTNLQNLLKTMFLALNNIINVGCLVILMLFTFTVAGMDLFGDITQGRDGFINSQVNFQTFYYGIMTLFRTSTGESWNGIMHDCMVKQPILAPFFWVSLMIFSYFIFVNVFIAVIYEEFQNVQQTSDATEVLSLKRQDITNFTDTWAKFNPTGSVWMPTKRFKEFLRELPTPLGYKGQGINENKLDKIIYCLNIVDHFGQLYFPEVMWAIFYSIIGNNEKGLAKCNQMKSIMRNLKIKYPALQRRLNLEELCGNKFYKNEITVTKYLSGLTILQNMRKLTGRKSQIVRMQTFSDRPKQERCACKTLKELWKAITNRENSSSEWKTGEEIVRIGRQRQQQPQNLTPVQNNEQISPRVQDVKFQYETSSESSHVGTLRSERGNENGFDARSNRHLQPSRF